METLILHWIAMFFSCWNFALQQQKMNEMLWHIYPFIYDVWSWEIKFWESIQLLRSVNGVFKYHTNWFWYFTIDLRWCIMSLFIFPNDLFWDPICVFIVPASVRAANDQRRFQMQRQLFFPQESCYTTSHYTHQVLSALSSIVQHRTGVPSCNKCPLDSFGSFRANTHQ